MVLDSDYSPISQVSSRDDFGALSTDRRCEPSQRLSGYNVNYVPTPPSGQPVWLDQFKKADFGPEYKLRPRTKRPRNDSQTDGSGSLKITISKVRSFQLYLAELKRTAVCALNYRGSEEFYMNQAVTVHT